jgi:hypothetical protein
VKYSKALLVVFSLLTWILACSPKHNPPIASNFTKQDSIMQQYLDYQDSLVFAWNTILHDDNIKIQNLNYILHELAVGKQLNNMVEESYKQRLTQLLNIRFTEKTFSNKDVVYEFDVAEEKLIQEISELAVQSKFYEQNRMLQNLTLQIEKANKLKPELRSAYNALAWQYNQFISSNKDLILKADPTANLELKSLFEIDNR